MGIYESGKIFGIRIYKSIDDECNDILLEKKNNKIFTEEEMKEVYLYYIELNDKSKIKFEYYTEWRSLYFIMV
jgi:hypothetical protein